MMFDLILLRPIERPLVKAMTTNLRSMVVDELHFYRGRQGADVAMLLRRLRQRASAASGREIQMIGTSATIASEGDRANRRRAIAQSASLLLGSEITSECVVDETLRRICEVEAPTEADALREAVEAQPPTTKSEFLHHPLAAWIEAQFGLELDEDVLVRRRPLELSEGARELADITGLEQADVEEALRGIVTAKLTDSENPFPFACISGSRRARPSTRRSKRASSAALRWRQAIDRTMSAFGFRWPSADAAARTTTWWNAQANNYGRALPANTSAVPTATT